MAPALAAAMREWFDTDHPGGSYTVCQPLTTRRKVRSGFMPQIINDANYHFHRTLEGSKWSVIRGFHDFRHSFASNLARAGVGSDAIDAFMGHQTEERRRRYRHLFPDQRKKAIVSVYG